MKSYKKRRGVLSFEWILITVVLTVGIIGGLASMRMIMLMEATDTMNAIDAIKVDFVKDPNDP